MENRKCFLIYNDYIEVVADLSDKDAGKLFKGILLYANGGEPELTGVPKTAFYGIKGFIKASIEKYEKKCAANRENGMKGGRPPITKAENPSVNSENPTETQNNPTVYFENPSEPKQNKTKQDLNKTKQIINETNQSNRQGGFVKPSVDDVCAYCNERMNNVDPEEFFNHYESNGWMVGKTPMKDWKAAVRTWEKLGYLKGKAQQMHTADRYLELIKEETLDERT